MEASFEAGARFRIVDEASPVLERLARRTDELNDIVELTYGNLKKLSGVRFGALGERMGKLTEQGAGLSRTFTDTFAKMQTSVAATVADMKLLSDEWRSIAVSATAAGRANAVMEAAAGGGGRHSRPGQMGLSAGLPGIPLPMGHAHVHGSTAAMIGAGALAYGMYEEGEFEDAAFRAMFTAGVPADPKVRTARMEQLRNIIQTATTQTGMPISDIEEATLTGIRQFAGMPWDKRLQILPTLLQGAAAEAVLKGKGTTVEEGMEVFTGLAHMTKNYSPEAIAKLIPEFAYLSTVDPEKITQMQKAASYAVPILQSGLGIDPASVLLLVATLQRAGVTNTKSGTWIREMALRAMPGTSLMSKIAFEKHEAALSALGLVNNKGVPTWFTEGKPDIIKMLEIAGEHAQQIPLTKRAAYERQLFGAQGSGAMAVLSDPTIFKQLKVLRDEMEKFKTGESFFESYSQNSPVEQVRKNWADIQKVLMDIGTTTLPPVVKLLKGFDAGLKLLDATLGKGMLGMLVTAGIGAAIGGRIAGPAGAAVGALAGATLPDMLSPSPPKDKNSPAGMSDFLGFGRMYDLFSDLLKKSSFLGTAPPPINLKAVFNMDGRQVAELVSYRLVRGGSGPDTGAAYFDRTQGMTPVDFVLAT